ncbi:unnamed protein product [Camellia sinensis]
MLQWLGGSRRKVTTSTQKRQKQYFEQRKRQQQQQTTGLDSFSDGMNTCSQHQNNNRSLDILSLWNLSTVVQNCKSSCRSEDAMIQDINWPLCGNFFELPFCSRGTENSFSKPRQKLSTAKEFSQFKSNASKLKNSFSDDEIFCNMEEKNDDIWNGNLAGEHRQNRWSPNNLQTRRQEYRGGSFTRGHSDDQKQPTRPSHLFRHSNGVTIFSLPLQPSLCLPNPNPKPNPNPNRQIHLPLRTQTLIFSSSSSQISTDSPPPPPPPPEKKSFVVATGELFLGIAARIIKRRNGIDGGDSNSVPITMFRDSERGSYFWRRTKEGIASVVEDPVQPEVVWEQRLKDVEAERCRKAVTSPGFSFSAAGFLFPYHLVAVTQILWRPRGLLVDQFDSKEDLINAVFTSSFIPGYLAPRPATMFSNRLCIDEGLTLFMPPTFATQTIRVCAFPASRLGLQGIGISPDCNPESRATPREALEPAEDDILDKLFEYG